MDIGLRIYGQVIVIVERRHSVLEMSESGPEIAVRGEESAPAQACPGRPSPAQPAPIPAQKAPRVFCCPGAGWAAHTLNGL